MFDAPTSEPVKEVAKIQLGLPSVASVEVHVWHGWWARFRRSRFPRWHELVVVVPTHIELFASDDDDGYVNLHLAVSNLGRNSIRIERVEMGALLVGQASVALHDASILGGAEVANGVQGVVRVNARFGAPGIRNLQRVLRTKDVGICSPRAAVQGEGRIDLSCEGARQSRSLTLNQLTPFVHLYNSSSRADSSI
jgi:hypothetical protein